VRCLCGVAVVVSVFTSIAGLRRRAGFLWALAGLPLGATFGGLLALSDPVGTGVVVIMTTVATVIISEWR
jgi:hypothetical protein